MRAYSDSHRCGIGRQLIPSDLNEKSEEVPQLKQALRKMTGLEHVIISFAPTTELYVILCRRWSRSKQNQGELCKRSLYGWIPSQERCTYACKLSLRQTYLQFLYPAFLSWPWCLRQFMKFSRDSSPNDPITDFILPQLHAGIDIRYMLSAIMELTISFLFSFNALTALFLETPAWAMTSSISFASNPESSTSSPSSSSSSFFASPDSMALPFPLSCEWLWPAWESPLPVWSSFEGVMPFRALSLIWELRSSILASPKILSRCN